MRHNWCPLNGHLLAGRPLSLAFSPVPRYCNSKLDSTPGTVFLTRRYGWRTSLFCSFGEAALHGRGATDVRRGVARFDNVKIRICLFPPSLSAIVRGRGSSRSMVAQLGRTRPFTPLGCPAAWCVLLVLFPICFVTESIGAWGLPFARGLRQSDLRQSRFFLENVVRETRSCHVQLQTQFRL